MSISSCSNVKDQCASNQFKKCIMSKVIRLDRNLINRDAGFNNCLINIQSLKIWISIVTQLNVRIVDIMTCFNFEVDGFVSKPYLSKRIKGFVFSTSMQQWERHRLIENQREHCRIS